ncbi:MAG: hypothetical protein AB1847_22850 [bacterium]
MPDDIGQINNIVDLKKEERKKKSSPYTYVEKELFKSSAWLSLSGIAPQVYTIFLLKRVVTIHNRKKGHDRKECINSQELVFTYTEAKEKYGITQPRFSRAIDDLIGKGFIDVVKSAGGLFKEATLYGLSDRWRKYGTAQFKEAQRPGRKQTMGFCKPKRKIDRSTYGNEC